MTRPQFLNIPSLSFSREKRLKNGIHATVNGKSDLISRSSAEMGLKLLDTDPFVRQLKDDQASLEEERDLFYERLDDTNSLEKSDRIVELEAIQKELKEFSSDVNEWVGTVKSSIRQAEAGRRRRRARSTAQPPTSMLDHPQEKSNALSPSSSTSTVSDTYRHPATYWNVALVDEINRSAKSPPVSANSDRKDKSDN